MSASMISSMSTQGSACSASHAGPLPAVEKGRFSTPSTSAQGEAPPLHTLEMSRLLLEQAGDGIYGLDVNGYVTFINQAAQEMTGWSFSEMRGHTQHSLVRHSRADGSPYPREDCPIYAALRGHESHHRDDEVFWRKDGSCFPVAYTSTPLIVDGMGRGAAVIFRDITVQVRARDWEQCKTGVFASIVAVESLRHTLSCLAEGMHRVNPTLAVAILVREGDTMHLRAEAELPSELRQLIDSVPVPEEAQGCGRIVLQATGAPGEREVPLSDSQKHLLRLGEWSVPMLSGTGEMLGVICLFGQVGERERERLSPMLSEAANLGRLAVEHNRLQQQLAHGARHDALTGLPNRALLEDRLEQAIVTARRQDTKVAVCYIDLDRFKQINDSLGHSVGDKYLQHITSTLSQNCRKGDTLARQGGDEFILVLPFLDNEGEALETAERMLHHLGTPFALEGLQFSASASIGISLYPLHGNNPSVLLQQADTALYAAKRSGRNQVCLFDPALGQEVKQSSQIQAGLHEAIANDQFHLVYQPIYGTNRELEGFEALLRWQSPTRGNIPPDVFIPVAEESGLIVPIGNWVLQQACRQMVEWQEQGLPSLRMFVNVSGVQLNREDFVTIVATTLKDAGLQPSQLGLEITETWIVADRHAAAERLRTLRELGITISIDDFGSGQSSFSYLHTLPLDTLKIDRSFIARLDTTSTQASTVGAIISLARHLGLRTLAEGVETEAQLEHLKAAQCDSLQGFFLARPLSVESASSLLRGLIEKERAA